MHRLPVTPRRILAIVLLGLLGACGFQLRGQAKLPFETLYVAIAQESPLGIELRRNIAAGTNTRLVNSAGEAQAILDLLAEEQDKSILSFDTSGRVREYRLRYLLAFRVRDARGRDYLPRSEIRVTREISYSDTQVLSKESEEQLLYREMQRYMVQQILRRLAASPAEPIVFETGAKDAATR